MANTQALQALSRIGSGSVLSTAAGALTDPRSVAVTFRSSLTPRFTTYPFSPVPQERQAPPRWSVGGLVMSALRPAVDVQAGSGGAVYSVEPYGDPDQLPLGRAMVALTAVGIGLAAYGAYKLARELLR